jgi:hypothetical protein
MQAAVEMLVLRQPREVRQMVNQLDACQSTSQEHGSGWLHNDVNSLPSHVSVYPSFYYHLSEKASTIISLDISR